MCDFSDLPETGPHCDLCNLAWLPEDVYIKVLCPKCALIMRTSLPPLHLHSRCSLILKRLSPFIQPAITFQLLYFLWSQFPQFSPYSDFSCTLVLYLWVYSVAKYEAVHFLPIFMLFFFLSKHLWAGIRSCLFSSVHVTCNSFSVFVLYLLGFLSFLSFFFFFWLF